MIHSMSPIYFSEYFIIRKKTPEVTSRRSA
jgi:hypothetical protein